jgi:hypothetical protein
MAAITATAAASNRYFRAQMGSSGVCIAKRRRVRNDVFGVVATISTRRVDDTTEHLRHTTFTGSDTLP